MPRKSRAIGLDSDRAAECADLDTQEGLRRERKVNRAQQARLMNEAATCQEYDGWLLQRMGQLRQQPRRQPELTAEERRAWATRQIETTTCEGELRAAVRVLMRGPHEPHRAFILYIRRRLLEVGAKLPHDLRA